VTRRLGLAAAFVAAALLALPAVAQAHGIIGRADLPIPKWLFGWGAAVVLIVSFVALATLWPKPQLEAAARRRVARIPGWVDPLCGVVGVALFALLVYAGFAGAQTAAANLVPTWVYVVFWVGLPFMSLFFGDVFRLFSPWRAVGRFVEWIAARGRGEGDVRGPIPYPEWLGRWPAVLGIFAFAWLELVYAQRDDPSTLALLALLYAFGQLVGMVAYGVATWTERADAFGVYFNLFSRLSIWERRDGVLFVRPPLSGVTDLVALPGTVALLCTMIGSTSFDGFSAGPVWRDLLPHLEKPFTSLGLNVENAVEAAYTLGLVVMIGLILSLFMLGIAGMRRVEAGHSQHELARKFVHSLVPIALAYVVAHYFSLLAYQGQALGPLLSDPLGHGKDYLGLANRQIDYTWVRAGGIWYVQVIALVIGHVAGLILAHDRALIVYQRAREATRSQLWMLCVMVAFTSLALWLLSAQNS
jgi:hypothetical protein